MSTVTVTDLPAGTAVVAADVNATLSSWNAATAAGQIGATNIRVEGIDRRTMAVAGNLVEKSTASASYFVDSDSLASAVTGAWTEVQLNGGLSNMRTQAAITAPATARLILHVSLNVRKNSRTTVANTPRVLLRLERSTDNGATWSKITGTTRAFQMRDLSVTGFGAIADPSASALVVPGVRQSIAWSIYVGTVNVATLYRVVYDTVNPGAGFIFYGGSISPECLLL